MPDGEIGFGGWLAGQIEAREMSQRAFAAAVGVHPSMVTKWICGRSTPRGRSRVAIARVLVLPREIVDQHVPAHVRKRT